MIRKVSTATILLMQLVLCSTTAQAEAEKKVRVELQLGAKYKEALGQDASQIAKRLAEESLANALGNKIKYFDFITSEKQGSSHTLTFRIDNPSGNDAQTGATSNLFDYYVFLDFNKDNDSDIDQSLIWLFRDAASNLNSFDTPETIAEKLNADVEKIQYERIAKDLLSKASFTKKAVLKSDGAKGWIIKHSRQTLCLAPNSKLKIESFVPEEGFEQGFDAEVKRRQSGDETSTFSLLSKDQDIQALLKDPPNAQVTAVYVISSEPECDNIFTESQPASINFAAGGNQ